MNTAPPFRIGQGYDCHQLVAGRELIVGGVLIPHPTGLMGHSDADVLLHAITDALIGAAALGDIGKHFPDTDKTFAGANSLALLREIALRVHQSGYRAMPPPVVRLMRTRDALVAGNAEGEKLTQRRKARKSG